jgi:nitrite reductase (NADH) small subunit/3-phenylpropionate/trans-cinnamate dioxygenase ferredoxin subunit
MPEFVKVARKTDLPSGEGMVVEVNGQTIALFNVGGEFFALDNVCPHRGGPLGEGYCDPHNLTVQCPWHGWVFSLRTGISPVNPSARVESFEVQVDGDDVKVSLG